MRHGRKCFRYRLLLMYRPPPLSRVRASLRERAAPLATARSTAVVDSSWLRGSMAPGAPTRAWDVLSGNSKGSSNERTN